MGESTKKKHRPVELNLKEPTKKDAALRIVSPGLPKLSPRMQTTMNESLQIERQQRELIAARNTTEQGADIKENESMPQEKVVVVTTSQPEGDEEESSRISTPSTAKRLKRDNAPPPLSLASDKSPSSKRLIQSAPLRPFFMGHHSKSALKQYGSVPFNSHRQYRRLQLSPPKRMVRPHAPHGVAYALPSTAHPRYSYAPYTAVAGSFPRGPYRHVSGPPHAVHSPILTQVTDVYHGDFTKAAPFPSQPLSAQQEAFGNIEHGATADRTLATPEEMLEMKRKHEQAAMHAHSSDAEESDDPELNAIDAEDRVLDETQKRGLTIFGSINLMNETVFNFKIYPSKENQQNSSTARSLSSDQDQSEESTSTTPEKASVPIVQAEVPDLQKQKEKFLKICETSWDEFVSTMG